jgi:hypothetical protein
VYTTIWNRYQDAFGKNLPAILSGLGPKPDGWNEIANQFFHEGSRDVFKPLLQEFKEQGLIEGGKQFDRDNTYVMQRISDIKSAPFGYSGMSFEEKEEAIYEKYRGKNSYIDFLNMQGELIDSLVYRNHFGREGESDYLSKLSGELTYNYVYRKYNLLDQLHSDPNPHRQLTEGEWKHLFSEQFDVYSFFEGFKESLRKINFYNNGHFDIDSVISAQIDKLLDSLD